MKQKILHKEETKTEVTIDQETLCVNINNLASALSSLGDIDAAILNEDLQDKLEATKTNLINSMYFISVSLDGGSEV